MFWEGFQIEGHVFEVKTQAYLFTKHLLINSFKG